MKKKKKKLEFLSENFHFLVVKFSVYLNRLIFVMICTVCRSLFALPLGVICRLCSMSIAIYCENTPIQIY